MVFGKERRQFLLNNKRVCNEVSDNVFTHQVMVIMGPCFFCVLFSF